MGSWGRGVVALGVMLAAVLVCVQSEAVQLNDYNGNFSDIPKPWCGPVCYIYCQYGNELDERGCPICKCREKPVCPAMDCYQPCPYGYVRINGCQTCRCRPFPVCPVVRCYVPCRYGYVRINGCQTCRCRRRPICPAIQCPNYRVCPYGYRNINGCPTCQCRVLAISREVSRNWPYY